MSLRWLRARTALAHAFCVFLRVFACTALALVWLPCTSAMAEAELDLVWRSAPGCPDAIWAAQQITIQLGRELSAAAETQLRSQVEIVHAGARFRLTLRTSRGEITGERTLEDARCEHVAEAATLMIALAIDESALRESQAQADKLAQAQANASTQAAPPPRPDQQAGPATTTPRRTGPQHAEPWPPARDQARTRSGLRARLSLLGDLGFLPSPSFGPELALGVHRPRFAAEMSGFWLPERRSRGAPRVAVSLWAVALRGCLHRSSERWLIGGCLGAELGRVSAHGMGLRENLAKRALFAAMDALLRTRLRLAPRVWLASDLGLSAPFFRQRFVTQNTGDQSQTTLHTPQLLTARASLGIEFAF